MVQVYACWRQQKLLVHILEKMLAFCHQSSSDHSGLLIENYCMQTHELWIDSYLLIRPPTLPVPLAAIQSWTMCETIMIFSSDLSGMFRNIYGRLKSSTYTSNFTLCVRLMKKMGLLQCFHGYNSSEKTNCILNLWMDNGNLKAIISSFISADIGVWHQIIKSSTL